VFERLQRLFRRKPALVRGIGSARPRTYSADSGYVYEYSFSGFRSAGGAYEYVFNVSGGRSPSRAVQVVLPEAVHDWTGRGRELTASERYGVAKVCLKNAMDRASAPDVLETAIRPGRDEVAEVADLLDL
jgi:hypothetical protein